jgi:hypothetical protein
VQDSCEGQSIKSLLLDSDVWAVSIVMYEPSLQCQKTCSHGYTQMRKEHVLGSASNLIICSRVKNAEKQFSGNPRNTNNFNKLILLEALGCMKLSLVWIPFRTAVVSGWRNKICVSVCACAPLRKLLVSCRLAKLNRLWSDRKFIKV